MKRFIFIPVLLLSLIKTDVQAQKISLWDIDVNSNHTAYKHHGPFKDWMPIN
jgi:hypothetical protein